MVLAVLLTLGGVAATMAVTIQWANQDQWRQGFRAATLISAISAILSLFPLWWGMKRGVMAATGCAFAAAGLRVLLVLLGGWIGIALWHVPAVSTLILLLVYYFALLAAETTVLAWSMWNVKV